jgi:hypothetical protein
MDALKSAIAGAMACTLITSAALAGPAVAIRYTQPDRWKDAPTTQEACLARAEAAILATGFGAIERTQQTRYGTMREYTAAVRCIMDKEIVVIIVSGPARQTADRGAAALFQNFETGK